MAANQVFCAICKELVADERVMQGSVTCSKQCANDLKNLRRRRRDLKKCRYCNAPSTPEERANYLRWRVEVLGRRGRGRPKKQKPEAEDSVEAAEPKGDQRPESDPMVIAALSELRAAEDIWLVDCPGCGWVSYWNEGSHASCRNCGKDLSDHTDEAHTLADYWLGATYPCDQVIEIPGLGRRSR